jgi:hypothetical protein
MPRHQESFEEHCAELLNAAADKAPLSHLASEAFRSHAFARWAKDQPAAAAAKVPGAARLQAIADHNVPEEDVAALLEQLQSAPPPRQREIDTIRGRTDPEEQQLGFLRTLEQLVRMYFCCNDDDDGVCIDVITMLRPVIRRMEQSGLLARHPNIDAAYLLYCMRRLLLQGNAVTEQLIGAAGDAVGKHNTPQCERLMTLMKAPEPDSAAVLRAVDGAANSIPLQFADVVLPLLQRLNSNYEAPKARAAEVPLDETVGDMFARIGKRPRNEQPDLVSGARQNAVPPPRQRPPPPPSPQRVNPTIARVVQAPPAGHSSNPACISKYHSKYGQGKHASKECAYCAVCHMLEALFNRNRRRCAWKHVVSSKRIATHLKAFPKALTLGKERCAEIEAGKDLPAVDDALLL